MYALSSLPTNNCQTVYQYQIAHFFARLSHHHRADLCITDFSHLATLLGADYAQSEICESEDGQHSWDGADGWGERGESCCQVLA
jgi:hypothetical protein